MAGLRDQRETAASRRMGAALTYARRYALFTLVVIAGEDDLDAPDLGTGAKIAADPPSRNGNGATPEDAPISKSQIFVAKAPPLVHSRGSQNSSAPRGLLWQPNHRPRCAIV